jgi:RimJ/RimL family protein N-acetyltransferase
MLEIQTGRLRLFPLTLAQLQNYLDCPAELEVQLDVSLPRQILTEPVRRAIAIKLEKMARADETLHPWYTYWLVVISQERVGAGLAGFKGKPDALGEVEIGYGMDPVFQGRGYTTEAACALIEWAFQDSACSAVIAPGTLKTNMASNRVLQKAGMAVYAEDAESRSYRIRRHDVEQNRKAAQ